MKTIYCGYTEQPPHPAPCGCTTVIVVYGLWIGKRASGRWHDAVNWCPKCEATWMGLEYRRYYADETVRP